MSRTISADDDLAAGFTVVDGLESVRQRIRQRLRLFRGEDYRAFGTGTPYYGELLSTRLPPAVAGQVIADEIRGVQDVLGVTDVEAVLDRTTRRLRVSAMWETRFGVTRISEIV